MELVAHNPAAAHRLGVAPSVGQEFVDADEDPAAQRHRHLVNYLAARLRIPGAP